MLRTRLSIQQRQRMAMSPGLRTGLSVLRMSTLDLIDAIEAEAADNPYLLHEDLRPRAASGAGSAYDVMLDTMAEVPSLIAKLHKQIGAMTLSPAVRAVAEYLAGDLREDGFLDTPLGDLAMSLDLPAVLIEQGLAALQSCDPVGVGARNLAECLTLQLIDRGLSADLAGNMIDHLHLFAVEDWRALQRAALPAFPVFLYSSSG